MTTKKIVRVPESAADDIPVVCRDRNLERTGEIAACEACDQGDADQPAAGQAAPSEIVADEVTVPVQSSIESTLTFELLRRQSKEEDQDEDENK